MSLENIMVSICCLAYNHEKYIRETLDGFLMQKTNFKYEILIHDDCSTDGTADIIREYEKKYPDIIKPIYQTENQYQKGVRISWTFQYPRANGKYLAFCEGDDFWTDENKLQKQFDIMEQNENCSVCCHKVGSVTFDGNPINEYFPAKDYAALLDRKTFLNELINAYQFHTSSYFLRASVLKQYIGNIPSFLTTLKVGDVGLLLCCAKDGGLAYIPDQMSSYRRNVPGSWTVRQKGADRKIKRADNYIEALKEYDEFTNYENHNEIEYAIGKCNFSALVAQKKFKEMLKKENRCYFNALSLKGKLIIIALAAFPFLQKIKSGK